MNYRVQATFFLVGNVVKVIEREKPGLLHPLVQSGNQIGYQFLSYHHSKTLSLNSTEWFIQDYLTWKLLLREVIGEDDTVRGVRPVARAPGGYFSPSFLVMRERLDLIPIGWNALNDTIIPHKKFLQKGDILLMQVTLTDVNLLKGYLSDLGSIAEKSLSPAPLPFFTQKTEQKNLRENNQIKRYRSN